MNVLLWLSVLWILYQCWLKTDWTEFINLLCLSEVNRESFLKTAKTYMRVFCFLYVSWHLICYYRARMQFRTLLGRITYFMIFYKIPVDIQDRVLQYYQQEWMNNKIKFPVSKFVLQMLPTELYNELMEHVGVAILDKLELHQECYRFFVSIAPKLKIHNYSPGELVCRQGTCADKMFLLVDGILEVTTASGQPLDTMSSGDVVGEIGVLHIDGNYLRTANVRSIGDSELLALHHKDLTESIKNFPEAKNILMTIGNKRLQRSKTMR